MIICIYNKIDPYRQRLRAKNLIIIILWLLLCSNTFQLSKLTLGISAPSSPFPLPIITSSALQMSRSLQRPRSRVYNEFWRTRDSFNARFFKITDLNTRSEPVLISCLLPILFPLLSVFLFLHVLHFCATVWVMRCSLHKEKDKYE